MEKDCVLSLLICKNASGIRCEREGVGMGKSCRTPSPRLT
jgi:hypothetical protein